MIERAVIAVLALSLSGIVAAYAATNGPVRLRAISFTPTVTYPVAGIGWTKNFDTNSAALDIKPYSDEYVGYSRGFHRPSTTIIISATNDANIRVFNYRGGVVAQGSPAVTNTFPVGHYFVECRSDRAQFAVLPEDYAAPAWWGDNSVAHSQWRGVTNGWYRSSALWSVVETNQGVYDWTVPDAETNYPMPYLVDLCYTVPGWVTSNNCVASWTNYVKAAIAHYQTAGVDLLGIEPLNEPYDTAPFPAYPSDAAFWVGQLCSNATVAAHDVDASLLVAVPAFYAFWGVDKIAEFQAAGAFAGTNVGLSWHNYSANIWQPDNTGTYAADGYTPAGVLSNAVVHANAFRTAAGLTNSEPLFVDEFQFIGASSMGQTNLPISYSVSEAAPAMTAVDRAIKFIILHRSLNAWLHSQNVYVSSVSDPPNAGFEINQRGPHPKKSAALMTCYWLNGCGLETSTQQGVLWNVSFTNATQRRRFLWTLEGATTNLPAYSGRAMDVFGNLKSQSEIDESPTMIRSSLSGGGGI